MELEQHVEERTHELRESEGRLQLAQQVTHSGTCDWSPRCGEATWSATWSEGAQAVFGLPPQREPVTWELWERCLHPEDRLRTAQTVLKALSDGQTYFDQYRIVKPTGDVCWIESQGRVLRDEAGEPLRMIGIVRDITERKRAEQELEAIA